MKIALWQCEGFPADKEANLLALQSTAKATAAAGASLLLCPECWLCGYNIGAAAGVLAETREGPSALRIGAMARQHQLAIAYGYAERDASGQVFNSVQVLGPDGLSLANYRKTHLWGPDERAAYQAGAQLEMPFDLDGFKIGLLICYDVEFPENVRSLALRGADLILVPTALSTEFATVPDILVPARAYENQLYIAYCNHTGIENGMRFLGRSVLAGMDGQPLAKAGISDALLVAQISKPARLAAADANPFLTDRRCELYTPMSSQ